MFDRTLQALLAGGGLSGSITWAASLAHDDYDNNVARLSASVLERFPSDAPF